MKRLRGPCWGVLALLSGAAAGGACGGQAMGDYDEGAGAVTGVGPGGMAGLGGAGRGGRGGTGGRGGEGGTAMAGGGGRGGSATGGQGAGGSVSIGGNAGVAGASMGGSSSMYRGGTCSSPVVLDRFAGLYSGRVERGWDNEFDACAGNGPEQVIRWIPPTSGRYFIDTFNSGFDTVLYVSSDLGCPPTPPVSQEVCNDDFSGVHELLSVQAVAGSAMLIVVDSYNSSGGDFTLNIRGEAECPAQDLGEQVGDPVYSIFEFASVARIRPFASAPECGGGELGLTFAWRAPATGVYRFTTSGSDFPAVLALRESCEGAFLGCINNGSELTLSMVQGQSILLEVTPAELEPLPSFGQLMLTIEPF